MARYYLGVDGGQSSTVALIADEHGAIAGIGRSGPCNHVSGPEAEAKFVAVLRECLLEAAKGLGFGSGGPEFAAACLGFSGGAEDKMQNARELIRTRHLKITTDAEIALIGATGGAPGLIIIAGTGSIAFGRNGEGRTARAGGWGYVFGDEGGGFDITRRAIRAALQHEEGWGPETSLRAALLAATGAASANELLHRFYAEMPRRTIAALARFVTGAAEAGDSAAQRILSEAAHALTWYVEGVHHALFSGGDRVPVAYVGGVFQSAVLLKLFREQVDSSLACPVAPPQAGPAAGALMEALRLDGNSATLSELPETKS